MADIQPDAQKQLITIKKMTLVKEAQKRDPKKNQNKGRVVPLKELYASDLF